MSKRIGRYYRTEAQVYVLKQMSVGWELCHDDKLTWLEARAGDTVVRKPAHKSTLKGLLARGDIKLKRSEGSVTVYGL